MTYKCAQCGFSWTPPSYLSAEAASRCSRCGGLMWPDLSAGGQSVPPPAVTPQQVVQPPPAKARSGSQHLLDGMGVLGVVLLLAGTQVAAQFLPWSPRAVYQKYQALLASGTQPCVHCGEPAVAKTYYPTRPPLGTEAKGQTFYDRCSAHAGPSHEYDTDTFWGTHFLPIGLMALCFVVSAIAIIPAAIHAGRGVALLFRHAAGDAQAERDRASGRFVRGLSLLAFGAYVLVFVVWLVAWRFVLI
jgi:hypothetical protein